MKNEIEFPYSKEAVAYVLECLHVSDKKRLEMALETFSDGRNHTYDAQVDGMWIRRTDETLKVIVDDEKIPEAAAKLMTYKKEILKG